MCAALPCAPRARRSADPLPLRPQKCEFLKRTARQGTGTPSACQMCDAPCPLNFLTTIMDLKEAIHSDVMQAIRLAAVCLGAGGFQKCICSVFGMMEPHWYARQPALCPRSSDRGPVGRRKVSTNKKVRCEEGDPLMRIIDSILQQVTILAEGLINQVIGMIDGILQSIGGWFGVPRLPRVCFPVASQPDRCDGGGLTREESNALAACYDESRGMQNLCYFERVRRICSDAALYEGYQSLFDIGYESVDDLKNQYAEAFGDTFNVIDPTLDALFSAVAVSEQTRNLDAQKGICDSQAFVNAMTLDMVCSRLSNPLPLCVSSAAPCVWTS